MVKGYPRVDWPKDWAWKDRCAADNSVHPVVDAIYRSIHRLVAKVMVCNDDGEVLMGRVERGHFPEFGHSLRLWITTNIQRLAFEKRLRSSD